VAVLELPPRPECGTLLCWWPEPRAGIEVSVTFGVGSGSRGREGGSLRGAQRAGARGGAVDELPPGPEGGPLLCGWRVPRAGIEVSVTFGVGSGSRGREGCRPAGGSRAEDREVAVLELPPRPEGGPLLCWWPEPRAGIEVSVTFGVGSGSRGREGAVLRAA